MLNTTSVPVRVGINDYDLAKLVLAAQGVQEEVSKDAEIEYIESPTIGDSKSILATKKDNVVHIFHNAELFRKQLSADGVSTVRMLTSYGMKKCRL